MTINPGMRGNIFRGNQVRLTAVRPDDLETLTRWYEDSDFVRRMDMTPAYPRRLADWQKWLADLQNAKDEFNFAVRRLDDEVMIGWIVLDGILWTNRTGWIGIGFGDAASQGRGYGGEAMRLLLKFAFHELNLHRVQLSVFSYNTPAIHLYEKLGFVREGVMREALQRDGHRFDLIHYGLLASEWAAQASNMTESSPG